MQLPTSIFLLTTLLSTLTTSTPVNPGGWSPNPRPNPTCLQPSQATEIVTQFSSLLTAFSPKVATSLLSPTNFSDTSDSINFLSSLPLGSTTFPSTQAFIAGQGSQPPIAFQVLAVDAVSCDGVVVFRWQAGVGLPGKQAVPVKGINVLYTQVQGGGSAGVVGTGGWQITRVYSEFNSAGWDRAVGGVCEPPKRGRL